MDEINKTYRVIQQEIALRRSNGFHVDSRLIHSITKSGRSPVVSLELNETEFLDLQFHANDASRLLTPHGESRTLRDCVRRMEQQHWTFMNLISDLGLSTVVHHPSWFNPCQEIYSSFSYDNFFSIFALPLTEDERQYTPTGSYSIYDGTHKSLVLAYKILVEGFIYKPILMYLFSDRHLLIH
jgi:hypothetical protein